MHLKDKSKWPTISEPYLVMCKRRVMKLPIYPSIHLSIQHKWGVMPVRWGEGSHSLVLALSWFGFHPIALTSWAHSVRWQRWPCQKVATLWPNPWHGSDPSHCPKLPGAWLSPQSIFRRCGYPRNHLPATAPPLPEWPLEDSCYSNQPFQLSRNILFWQPRDFSFCFILNVQYIPRQLHPQF